MRLATLQPRGAGRRGWRLALVDASLTRAIDVAEAAFALGIAAPRERPEDYLDWFDLDGPWFGLARAVVDQQAFLGDDEFSRRAGAAVVPAPALAAAVPRPGKIVCVGLNYRDHAAEAGLPVPDVPILFAKFPSAVIGTGEPIVIPAASSRIDYEAELAIVIGRTAHGVTADRAAGVILGFTAANDVSARDLQKRDGQWVRSKSIDTFGPLGPAIVTAEEVGDANALGIRCRVNGRTLQDSSTREFVFRVEELVAFISDTITLEPGDVILTGTPPGVGYARSPAIYLAPGDVVEVDIDGIGVLRNPVQ